MTLALTIDAPADRALKDEDARVGAEAAAWLQ